MSFETAAFVSLFVTLIASTSYVLILCLIFTWTRSPQAAVKPRLRLQLSHRRVGDRVVPITCQAITSREHGPDALARRHCRALLLFNYRDHTQIDVTALRNDAEWGITIGIRDLAPDLWYLSRPSQG